MGPVHQKAPGPLGKPSGSPPSNTLKQVPTPDPNATLPPVNPTAHTVTHQQPSSQRVSWWRRILQVARVFFGWHVDRTNSDPLSAENSAKINEIVGAISCYQNLDGYSEGLKDLLEYERNTDQLGTLDIVLNAMSGEIFTEKHRQALKTWKGTDLGKKQCSSQILNLLWPQWCNKYLSTPRDVIALQNVCELADDLGIERNLWDEKAKESLIQHLKGIVSATVMTAKAAPSTTWAWAVSLSIQDQIRGLLKDHFDQQSLDDLMNKLGSLSVADLEKLKDAILPLNGTSQAFTPYHRQNIQSLMGMLQSTLRPELLKILTTCWKVWIPQYLGIAHDVQDLSTQWKLGDELAIPNVPYDLSKAMQGALLLIEEAKIEQWEKIFLPETNDHHEWAKQWNTTLRNIAKARVPLNNCLEQGATLEKAIQAWRASAHTLLDVDDTSPQKADEAYRKELEAGVAWDWRTRWIYLRNKRANHTPIEDLMTSLSQDGYLQQWTSLPEKHEYAILNKTMQGMAHLGKMISHHISRKQSASSSSAPTDEGKIKKMLGAARQIGKAYHTKIQTIFKKQAVDDDAVSEEKFPKNASEFASLLKDPKGLSELAPLIDEEKAMIEDLIERDQRYKALAIDYQELQKQAINWYKQFAELEQFYVNMGIHTSDYANAELEKKATLWAIPPQTVGVDKV